MTLVNVFAFLPFERGENGKVRNRYFFSSLKNNAKNCGTAVYVRIGLARIIDMVRIRSGEDFSPMLVDLASRDSVTTARLRKEYQSNHPAWMLDIEALIRDLEDPNLTERQLIKGLVNCMRANFKFKAEYDENHRQRVEHRVDELIKRCLGTNCPGSDGEWVRVPGGSKSEPKYQENAELIQIDKLTEGGRRVGI